MKKRNGKRARELAVVTPVSSNPQEPVEGIGPMRDSNLLVTFATPKQAIAVGFYNTAEGIRWNIWEWDGRPTSELYNRELQVVTPDIRRNLLRGHFTVKPRAALEECESLHNPPASLRPVQMQIDGPDNKINLMITEGKRGFQVYSGRLFEPLRRIALHRAEVRAKNK